METTDTSQYSETINRATESYSKLQEVSSKLMELEATLKATMQKRLHAQDPKVLDDLKIEIGRLSKQILFFDEEKRRLTSEVAWLMDENRKGQSLMDEVKPKHVN